MPALISCGRRWLLGSDDLIVPALIFVVLNCIWVLVLSYSYPSISAEQAIEEMQYVLPNVTFGSVLQTSTQAPLVNYDPLRGLRLIASGFIIMLLVCVVLEASIAYVSSRGSLFYSIHSRSSIPVLLYVRIVILFLQLIFNCLAIVWLGTFYDKYLHVTATKVLVGVVVWQFLTILLLFLFTACTYDRAGRRWLRVHWSNKSSTNEKRDPHMHSHHKSHLNLLYRANWDRRCRALLCCGKKKADDSSAIAEVAQLLSEFFCDLDVVPTDIVAGLLLMRKAQKLAQFKSLQEAENTTFEYLSGVAIDSSTKFLALESKASLAYVTQLRYYMCYALAVYGWPFYWTNNKAASCCTLLSKLRPPCCSSGLDVHVEGDNCCSCDLNALLLTLPSKNIKLIYVNFKGGVSKSPFFLAVDKDRNAVVLCIRGTLSLKDFLTDFCAQSDSIPNVCENGEGYNYRAHSGMISVAKYVYAILMQEKLLDKAFQELGTDDGRLMLVGHSLGGGTVTILGFMLRKCYPTLHCFVYAPPGGTLSWQAAQASDEFVSTVVVGKDLVARLGLFRLEKLRSELLKRMKIAKDTKWKIISQSFPCCSSKYIEEASNEPLLEINGFSGNKQNEQKMATIEEEPNVAVYEPMYPPGRLLHIVRSWTWEMRKAHKPMYTALWPDKETAFEGLLISPVMVHDHMPEGVIEALDGLLLRCKQQCKRNSAADANGIMRMSMEIEPAMIINSQVMRRHAPLAESEASLTSIHATEFGTLNPFLTVSSPALSNFQNEQRGRNPTAFSIGETSESQANVNSELYRDDEDETVVKAWQQFYQDSKVPSLHVSDKDVNSIAQSNTPSTVRSVSTQPDITNLVLVQVEHAVSDGCLLSEGRLDNSSPLHLMHRTHEMNDIRDDVQ